MNAEKIFLSISRITIRYKFWVLLTTAILVILSVFIIQKLKLNADFSSLLDRNHPVIKNLDRVTEEYGGIGSLIIAINADTFERGAKFVEDAVPDLLKNKDIRYVDFKKPISFLKRNLLLYLDLQDISVLRKRLHNKLDFERQKANPVTDILGLLESDIEDPGFYYQDILDKYKRRANLDFNFEKRQQQSVGDEYFYSFQQTEKLQHRFVLLVKPLKSSVDMSFSKKITSEIRDFLEQRIGNQPQQISFRLTGRYQKKLDTIEKLGQDMKTVSWISIISILCVIIVYFRNIRFLLILTVSLVCGLLFTFATTTLLLGHLNLVTSMLAAILLGLGIDFGIHYLARFKEDIQQGNSLDTAIKNMLVQTGQASFISAVTTAIAFFILMLSNFRAFSEFGLIAGLGILFIFFSMTFIVPALLAVAYAKDTTSLKTKDLDFSISRHLTRFPLTTLLMFTGIAVLSFLNISKVQFDYNFSKLTEYKGLESYATDIEVNKMFKFSLTPSIILAESEALEQEYERAIEDYRKSFPDGKILRVDRALSLRSFIPAEQNAKLREIKKIDQLLQKYRKYRPTMSQAARTNFDAIAEYVVHSPVTEESLPQIFKNNLLPVQKSSHKRIVLVFPKADLGQGSQVLEFAEQMQQIKVKGKQIPLASDSLVFAEIIKLIFEEGYGILAMCYAAIVLLVFLILRNLSHTFLVLLPLTYSLFCLAGLMGFWNFKLDFFNVIMFPILLGIGIDNGVHLFSRYKETQNIQNSLSTTGKAITASTLTTLCGFGALAFSESPGISGIGKMAVLGMSIVYISFSVLLPQIIVLYEKYALKVEGLKDPHE
jgi:predicted RND superfamily exporter protein